MGKGNGRKSEMNGAKELIRNIWIKTEDAVRRNWKTSAIAGIALALVVPAMILYGIKEKPDHAAGTHNEDVHEEADVVHLSEEAQRASGLEVLAAALEPFSAPIEATAAIELNGDRVAKISARASGRLVEISASQGDAVRAGQALAWFDSPELGQAWAEYTKAKGRADLARKNLEREETLYEKKISPEKDVLRARQELAEADADLAFAREKFHLLGVDIDRFEKKHERDQHPLIAVTSPISGSIIERAATQGEVVGPDKPLFTVADLSKLWVIIDLYEKDLHAVRAGTTVKVATAAYAEKNFTGIISYVGAVMDEKTRTVKARVEVQNANRLLKPGMFAIVTIDVKGPQTQKAILVPDEAVQMAGDERFVFVRTGPETFEKKKIKPGRIAGKRVEVVEGLAAGDQVVVRGMFTLKSELKKEELSEDAHGH
jgi:cobalt-zinc-cadmium efflux system membrane fusion protein